ncbi:MAG: hypothetical protein DRO93_11840 [Candidatus Thorarchaeota archaeon]|nr:MAG: hypothetical protein DRO93_11840 [Candidatus Thorarchaeota archaeon]
MANVVVLALVGFLHTLFTAIWIGGMIALALTVLTTIRKTLGMGPESKKLIDNIRNSLSKITYVAFIVLIATGVLMSNSSPLFQGFFTLGNEYSLALTLKHILVAIMIVIAILRSRVVPRLDMEEPKRMKLMMMMLVTNIILGCAVLFLSSLLSAVVRTYLLEAVSP